MKYRFLQLIVIFLVYPLHSISAGQDVEQKNPAALRVIKQDQSGIHLQVEFDRRTLANPANLQRLIRQSFLVWQDSVYAHPLLTRSFIPFTQHVTVQIMHADFQTIRPENIAFPVESAIDTTGPSFPADLMRTQPNAVLPRTPLIKISSGNMIHAVNFYPIQPGESTGELRFYYRIEANLNFDLSAPVTEFNHAKLSAAENSRLRQKIINFSSWQNFQQQVQPVLKKGTGTENNPVTLPPACNLVISRDGWYRVTYAQLKAAGVPVDFLNPKRLQLFCKGEEIPIYFSGDGDSRFETNEAIEFWGERNRNTYFPGAEDIFYDPFSWNSVYVLVWNQKTGLRYGVQNSLSSTGRRPPKKPFYFRRKIHVEEDHSYYRLGWATAGSQRDHWFNTQIASGELKNIPLDLPISYPYSLEPIHITLWFHGRTINQHRIEVYLNRHYIGAGEWFGPEKFKFTAEINDAGGAILAAERHTLTIANRSPDELDFVLYNYLDIDYPQAYEAKNNFLLFKKPANENAGFFNFRLKNFTDPRIEIFKIGAYRMFNADILETQDSLHQVTYQVRFQDECYSTDDRYVALTPAKKMSPDTLFTYRTDAVLTSRNNQADYLIITPAKFSESTKLQEFIQFRAQKYQVKLVKTEDIYRQFNFGIPGPEGIKNFLQYTQKFWRRPAPAYVLLAGDGNYNYRSAAAQRKNYVPVYHYQTYKFGAAASDNWYVTDENGHLSDHLHIGRWPVKNSSDLEIMVDKTISYESSNLPDRWQNRLFFIAGNGQYFRDQTSDILHQIAPPAFFTDQLHSSPVNDPFFGDTERLIETWNEGVAYVNFRGHGGGAVWADNLLFRFEDVARLNNQNRLPFVTSMTCFTCAFDGNSNLGESLLLYPDGGAVAMLGASGVGWIWNDYYLLRELLTEMFTVPEATIGQIISAGKRSYAQKYFTPQVSSDLHQYNLLGDPALVLKLPWKKIELTVPLHHYSPGDSIDVGTDLLFSSGQIILKLQNENGLSLSEWEEKVQAQRQSFRVELPAEVEPGSYRLKAFAFSDDQSWLGHGAAQISVGGLTIQQITMEPLYPTAADSIRIFTHLLGVEPNDSILVYFAYRKEETDSLAMYTADKTGIYQIVLPPQFAAAGETVPFHVTVVNGSHIISSKTQILQISQLPDFSLVSNSLKIDDSASDLLLSVQIRNHTSFSADSVDVAFWASSSIDSIEIPLGTALVQLQPFRQTTASVAWSLGLGTYRITVRVDPRQKYPDANLSDNLITAQITSKAMQITRDILKQGVLRQEFSGVKVQFDLASNMSGRVLQMEGKAFISTPQQDLQLYTPQNWPQPVWYTGFRNEAENTGVTAQLDFQPDSLTLALVQADTQLALYHYYSRENRWAKIIDQKLENGVIHCAVQLGKFAWFHSGDVTPPEVKILTQNRGFYDGGYVQKNPRFTIRVDDVNGAHPGAAGLWLTINGQPVTGEDYELRRNYQNGSQLVQIELAGLSGENKLQAVGRDCSGNLSQSPAINFRVADEADILPLGNYPNPFIDQTVFAYKLTATVNDLRLKIFTASGKLIRTIKVEDIQDDPNPCEVGYHEITWEGRNNDGDDVANGVYFFQYVVKSEAKTIKKQGKLARIQ